MAFEILVVDDDRAVLRTIGRMLPADVTARTASTKQDAIELLREHTWPCRLVLIDVKLGSERLAGLEVLDVAASERKAVPRAIITGSKDLEVQNRAVSRRAYLIRKPFGAEQLAALIDCARPQRAAVQQLLERRGAEWGFTPRQQEIFALLLAGNTRPEIARHLGIAENTVRRQIQQLLPRCQERSVDGVIIALLRDAIADLENGGGRS